MCQEGIGPYLAGGVLVLSSPTQLLELESPPAPGTDARVANRSEPQGGPEGAPDRCQVQRESQAIGDSRELCTKGSKVTGEKQGQMGPASQCPARQPQISLAWAVCSHAPGRAHTGPDPAFLQMLTPLPRMQCVCFILPSPESVANQSRTCGLLVTPALSLLWARHSTVCKAIFTLIAFRVPSDNLMPWVILF